METSTSKKSATRRLPSRERALREMDIYRAAELTLPLDVWARLNDEGVIVR
jgi:hypothetical protein